MKLSIVFVVTFFPCFLQSQVLNRFEVLPQQKIVPVFTADATAHRLGVTAMSINRRVSVSLGNIVPIADVEVYGQPLRIGVGASIHAEIEPDKKANLVTTDYIIDYALLDIPFANDWILRTGVGHASHHLSDDWYELLNKTSALKYSKDYVQLFVVKKIPEYNLFVYGGAIYTYNFIVNHEIHLPWMLQCGGEQVLASYVDNMLALYCALDMKVRQEASFASTQSYQFGVRIQNTTERTLRLAYQFRNGIDERGQFYTGRRSFHGLSLFAEF